MIERIHNLIGIKTKGRRSQVYRCRLPFFLVIFILFFNISIVQVKASAGKKSYYDILGVSKTADKKDIKKAYRKLALRHHPDKGGDEEKFKEISKAYDTLSDPDQRQLYDTYGDAGLEMGGPNAGSFGFNADGSGRPGNPFAGAHASGINGSSNPFQQFFSSSGSGGPQGVGGRFRPESFSFGRDGNIDISELLRHMMGGAGGQPRPFGGASSTPPSSYTRTINCTLEDLACGATKKLKLSFEGKAKIYTIHLKPGWKQGTKVTFPAGKGTGIPTMVFLVQELPHKYLTRDGDDLRYVCWISEEQTHGGIKVKIPLPTGETWSRSIPKADDASGPVLPNGESLVIPSKGMPKKGGPERGNLIIQFKVRRSNTT